MKWSMRLKVIVVLYLSGMVIGGAFLLLGDTTPAAFAPIGLCLQIDAAVIFVLLVSLCLRRPR